MKFTIQIKCGDDSSAPLLVAVRSSEGTVESRFAGSDVSRIKGGCWRMFKKNWWSLRSSDLFRISDSAVIVVTANDQRLSPCPLQEPVRRCKFTSPSPQWLSLQKTESSGYDRKIDGLNNWVPPNSNLSRANWLQRFHTHDPPNFGIVTTR